MYRPQFNAVNAMKTKGSYDKAREPREARVRPETRFRCWRELALQRVLLILTASLIELVVVFDLLLPEIN